jgi:hypothetical protein
MKKAKEAAVQYQPHTTSALSPAILMQGREAAKRLRRQ